jgi:protein arginine kinase activator
MFSQCEVCQKAIATVHYMELENGSQDERHFCKACAESTGILHKPEPLKIPEFLENLIATRSRKPRSQREIACPGCGLTYQQFKMRGRLGCARCYRVFHRALEPLLEKIHDASRHRGKYPSHTPAPVEPGLAQKMSDLNRRLDEAKLTENYEDAARLRDEIHRLRQERKQRGQNPPIDSWDDPV